MAKEIVQGLETRMPGKGEMAELSEQDLEKVAGGCHNAFLYID